MRLRRHPCVTNSVRWQAQQGVPPHTRLQFATINPTPNHTTPTTNTMWRRLLSRSAPLLLPGSTTPACCGAQYTLQSSLLADVQALPARQLAHGEDFCCRSHHNCCCCCSGDCGVTYPLIQCHAAGAGCVGIPHSFSTSSSLHQQQQQLQSPRRECRQLLLSPPAANILLLQQHQQQRSLFTAACNSAHPLLSQQHQQQQSLSQLLGGACSRQHHPQQQQQRGVKQLRPYAEAPKLPPRFRKPSKDGRINRMVIRIPPQVQLAVQDGKLLLTGECARVCEVVCVCSQTE